LENDIFFRRKSLGAFGQPVFFLAGNCMTTVTFENKKVFFLKKSLAYLAKRFSLTEVKLRT